MIKVIKEMEWIASLSFAKTDGATIPFKWNSGVSF